MDERLLHILEKDAHIDTSDIATMMEVPEEQIISKIYDYEQQQIICGYHTLINWDKTNKEFVTALIEVKVTPQRGLGFDRIAERIYLFDEVKAVYLMSGGFDLTVIVEGKTMKEVAMFVSEKLAALETVLSTSTHFVLKKYKDHGIILDGEREYDERMMVSP